MRNNSITRFAFAGLVTCSLIYACLPVAAQEDGSAAPVQKDEQSALFEMYDIQVIPLEHARATNVLRLMSAFTEDGVLTADDDLNAVLLAGPKQIIERLEAAIKLLDVPQKSEESDRNVELTVHLIQGSGFKKDGDANAQDVPTALADVITELSGVFAYDQYRLVDTLFLRCRDGSEASTSGLLPNGSSDANEAFYHFGIERVRVFDGDPLGIRLDDVSFGATIPYNLSQSGQPVAAQARRTVQRREVGIRADIDVREGQHVVVGKASVSSDDTALFVVISAKVVGG